MKRIILIVSLVLACSLVSAQEDSRGVYIIDGTETLYLVDGVVSKKDYVDRLSENGEIKNMEVVKGIKQAVVITTTSGKVVSGRVVDTDGNPMQGVLVMIPNTRVGVVTDAEGNYRINIPAGEAYISLRYDFIDYPTKTVPVDKLEMGDVVMDKNAKEAPVSIRIRDAEGKDIPGEAKPLIMVKKPDGEIYRIENMESISPESIKTLSVSKQDKSNEQFKKYGDVSNGVIFIELK